MSRPSVIWREELASTSTTLAAEASELNHGAVIAARRQTSGRGQRGNSWESAPG
ncbi:MAG: biotin--[acetyl-CoA-carboxylase] ligase, partial [Muribaculaceae bacterium]|nr:biotin--[acetyl-CoA-carboxylase] ligase [Muribaculaceae bacterium]